MRCPDGLATADAVPGVLDDEVDDDEEELPPESGEVVPAQPVRPTARARPTRAAGSLDG
jgi:hypothetical protein